MSIPEGKLVFQCDCCQLIPIQGVRFRCKTCRNFDLCLACRDAGKHNPKHGLTEIIMPAKPIPAIIPSVITAPPSVLQAPGPIYRGSEQVDLLEPEDLPQFVKRAKYSSNAGMRSPLPMVAPFMPASNNEDVNRISIVQMLQDQVRGNASAAGAAVLIAPPPPSLTPPLAAETAAPIVPSLQPSILTSTTTAPVILPASTITANTIPAVTGMTETLKPEASARPPSRQAEKPLPPPPPPPRIELSPEAVAHAEALEKKRQAAAAAAAAEATAAGALSMEERLHLRLEIKTLEASLEKANARLGALVELLEMRLVKPISRGMIKVQRS